MAKTKIDDPSGVTIPAITATPEADFVRKMVELKARSLNALEDALTRSVLERARRDIEPKPKLDFGQFTGHSLIQPPRWPVRSGWL